jgi:hypothetical protein
MYEDGREHLRFLERAGPRLSTGFVAELKRRGIDFARQCYCDGPEGCPCGYLRYQGLHTELRLLNATPCSKRGACRRSPFQIF